MIQETQPQAQDAIKTSPARPALARTWRGTRQFRPVLVLLVALVIFFAITQPVFTSSANLADLGTAVSGLWVVAIGMTFVLLSGGIDLSVGAMIAFLGIFLAKMLGLGIPGGLVVLMTILAGALIGAGINGVMIGKLRLSFFVVTLASMTALTGVVNLWSATQSFYVNAPVFADLAINHLLGVPVPIWIMAAVLAVGLFVQRRTYFGRDVYAVGGNMTAAQLSGIRTSRTLIAVYGLSGGCAALAAVIGVGRVGSASPIVDPTVSLEAIAAVLLGGTTLEGGTGSIVGTGLGVLFIGVLQNGLGLAGVPSFWQEVVTGVILVSAVLGNRLASDPGALTRWPVRSRSRHTRAAQSQP